MDRQERAARLKAMLSQIAPRAGIESIPRPQVHPEFPAGLESFEVDTNPAATVESGLQKMVENREHDASPAELFALEAIVMPTNRPVVFVRGGSYDDVEAPWTALNAPDVKARLNAVLPFIGRVEVPNSPLLPYAGTGFVVGKNLLMTNRHVAEIFTEGLGLRIRYQPGGAAINFKREFGSPDDDSPSLVVRSVVMIHPYWDMALLAVDGLPSDRALDLSVGSPEDLVGRNIVAIGYPARDERSDLTLQDKIFHKIYQVKRLQPGTVRARAQVSSFENVVNAMTHDSSTLGGNSGSAIVDVNTGEVLALHFAGEYLKANYAVPMYELARDGRVAAKLNFQNSLPPTNDWEPAWQRAESNEQTPSPMASAAANAVSPPLQSLPFAVPRGDRPDLGITWNIPLRVTVSLGQPSVVSDNPTVLAPSLAVNPVSETEEEAVVVDKNYKDRPGYEPKFLGDIEVPLPGISKRMKDDTAVVRQEFLKGEDQFELTYYHYSIYMNKRRRTAWFSAANVDGGHRPAIGKRQGDKWFTDPRISLSEQLGQEAFEHGIDRGHLTRREDTAWGKDVASARKANNDTFHFTNCSLQAAPFNRGKDRWQGLEQFLLEKHAKKDKQLMVVITGPVFATNDPVYRNDNMDYAVRCPIQFWKVCVLVREDGTPSATGFVLGQEDITNLPGFEEAFDVAATQVKIADLEKKTGLDFGELKKHDHFAQGGALGTLELPGGEEGQLVKAIRTGEDIYV
jgi:endonuclease G, mitochondrial